MGFLEAGTPLEWTDTEDYHRTLEYVLEHGVLQFLEVYAKVKDRTNDRLLWGDETEYHMFREMPDGTVKLSLDSHLLLAKLEEEDEELLKQGGQTKAVWHPEYGSWMIEATPAAPYTGFASDLIEAEKNMRYRRRRILAAMEPNQGLSSMVAWPLMGVGDFCVPEGLATLGPVAKSLFLPDEVINHHPRFATLTRNIRKRRGKKVQIRVPLYRDINTDVVPTPIYKVESQCNTSETSIGEIYMDAMGFGMGCCCLQVTFQARDVTESRTLYDQLAMLCPIFLALSAACPILKGYLADTDVRWNTIVQSVDCRTPVNMGCSDTPIILPGGEIPQRGTQKIAKSRYDSIDCFISESSRLKPEYNDSTTEVNSSVLATLVDNGIDERLAKHVAHLFVRDPLVVFSERISEVDDKTSTEHFENIQSTNWNSMRWKPPGLDVKTGWRVEFRTMEKQLTDFENAAYVTAIVLITRVILFFDLNLYIPISKIDENMARAHSRNAVITEKFFFRKELVVLQDQCDDGKSGGVGESEFTEMSIADILQGKGEEFPGLVPLIYAYLDIMQADAHTVIQVSKYLDFLVDRATGKLPTIATWMREFVQKHPDYKQDSIITEKIGSDLVKHCDKISRGEIQEPALYGLNPIAPLVEQLAEDLKNDAGQRLRGASFHEEIGSKDPQFAYRCSLVRSLVKQYKSKYEDKHNVARKGFSNTPAFLDIPKTNPN